MQGAILNDPDGYQGLGGVGSPSLREPTSEQTPLAGGYVSYFQGPSSCGSPTCGAIYWSASTGTHAVWGDNYTKYSSLGGPTDSALGFPVSNPVSAGDGLANYFGTGGPGPYGSKAAIYWSSASGAHAVWGDDYRDYLSHSGSLGLPLSDPDFSLPGDPAYFVGPSSCSATAPKGPQRQLRGHLLVVGHRSQCHLGRQLSRLSPSHEFARSSDRRVQSFSLPGDPAYFVGPSSCSSTSPKGPSGSCGAIYWSSATGANAIWGDDYLLYVNTFGGPGGRLGLPTSDPIFAYGGAVSTFQHGAIYSKSDTGTHELDGGLLQTYLGAGGPGGNLGFPLTGLYTNSLGQPEAHFVGGWITWKNGAWQVTLNCVGTGLCS